MRDRGIPEGPMGRVAFNTKSEQPVSICSSKDANLRSQNELNALNMFENDPNLGMLLVTRKFE